MTNETDTNVVNIQDFRARRQPAQTAENPAYLATKDPACQETPGTVIPLNDMQAARVLERLIQDWRVARLDEFSRLHGDKTTKLDARIIDIYSNHPDCIQYIAGKSGELLYILDALNEGYCKEQEEQS